ncbi:hypothetical protein [Phycisphaera mikurensis]|uniref:Uncharacterized protein n=1 Tax=Phycisphaera mikurensis (strain NBRC 102666 / KCTC 22515 / FYK2301M01) TaxID=1142394 RepID=I0IG31_PHYMF|nr:hypothetical protein [Phycisphaera mikurensis]MBB6440397.1 hypothetical protein [Phycisphaera mikurensis]BAM04219.1 hypothetical protein PSMK_20600 [Phycisphaera mikurensis NBRC 102666]
MDREGTTESTTIRDSDRATEGGPPGWLAFVIVAVLFLIGAIAVAAISILT